MSSRLGNIFFSLAFLCAATSAAAEDSYESLLSAASQTTVVKDKLEFYSKAASLAGDEEKKMKALREGFEWSVKGKDKPNIAFFGNLLADCKGLKDQERAEVKFKALEAAWPTEARSLEGISPKPWENFLLMPGISPELEIAVLLKISANYEAIDQIDKAIATNEKIVSHSASDVSQKADAMIALSKCNVLIQKREKAIEYLNKILELKDLPGPKRAKAYVLLGDTILPGSGNSTVSAVVQGAFQKEAVLGGGYYFEASEKDYADACDAYKKAAETKYAPQDVREDALKKIADAYFNQKLFQKASDACEEILNNKKQPPSREQWNRCMMMLGRAKIELKDYEGAINCFDQAKKTNTRSSLGDVYRFLGLAYYKNKDYVLALGAYSTAREILEDQERVEDDRPIWCKGWINKIKWFTANAPQLDAAMKKRAQKLEAAAKAEGKAPVKSKVSDFKSASDGAKNPETKKPQKKKSADEVPDVSSDLLENGLQ